MPYGLRKSPKKELYWVFNKETGHKFSKLPLPKERAEAQRRAIYASQRRMMGGAKSPKKKSKKKSPTKKSPRTSSRFYFERQKSLKVLESMASKGNPKSLGLVMWHYAIYGEYEKGITLFNKNESKMQEWISNELSYLQKIQKLIYDLLMYIH